MGNSNNDSKHFTAEDIRRYLSGAMTAAERHSLEKAALDDPFLADAIEGHSTVSEEKATIDLRELGERLHQRAEQRSPAWSWWKIAAAIAVLLSGIIVTTLLVNQPTRNAGIAQIEQAQHNDTQPQETTTSKADSTQLTIVAPYDSQAAKSKANEKVAKTESKIPAGKGAKPNEDSEQLTVTIENKKAEDDVKAAARTAAPSAVVIEKTNDESKKDVPAFISADKNYKAPLNSRFNFFRGQVVSPEFKPVPFANISIANTNSITYTDARGNFNLLSADSLLNVEVKSVGYANQSSFIQSSAAVDNNRIILKPIPESLSELNANANRAKRNAPSNAAAKKAEESSDADADPSPFASPVDGWEKYDLYLLNNKHMSYDIVKNESQGSVMVSFIVDEKGKLSDFRIEKSLCTACDKEAIRLIKEGPKWQLESGAKPTRTHVTVIF